MLERRLLAELFASREVKSSCSHSMIVALLMTAAADDVLRLVHPASASK